MSDLEAKKYYQQLTKGEIAIFDIPSEYQSDAQIASYEKKKGLRVSGRKGYDINYGYFVEDTLIDGDKNSDCFITFEDFDSYYKYLSGDIYDNACYAFCNLSTIATSSCKIDLERLVGKKSFIENTIDDYSLTPATEELIQYEAGKQIHKHCLQWIKKFNNCCNYEELSKVARNYKKSSLYPDVSLDFFLSNYIFANLTDYSRFRTLMKYLSSDQHSATYMVNALCAYFNPDDVINSYVYTQGNRATFYKRRKKHKEYIDYWKEGKLQHKIRAFFDEKTHFFCEETQWYHIDYKYYAPSLICRYFENFDEFIKYRHGDLQNCDLSGALDCKVNFSYFYTDQTTKLPACSSTSTYYSIEKVYEKKDAENTEWEFKVKQQWRNQLGSVIKEEEHSFKYFFDFAAFLKGDLSGANLLFCDGLENLEHWDGINFSGAKMRSSLCEKFGIKYNKFAVKTDSIKDYGLVLQNESESALVPQTSRKLIEQSVINEYYESTTSSQLVHYISDIHLMHKIQQANCRSYEDVTYVIKRIVDNIDSDIHGFSLLLINGDVASDFRIFKMFVEMLSEVVKPCSAVVFTLGNHDLWSFPDYPMNEIVSIYRSVLDQYGMYLLQNDILYEKSSAMVSDSDTGIHVLKYDELCSMSNEQISAKLKNSIYVILGGLGFSGYNEKFNANNGIYGECIDRKAEINESRKFETLYNRLTGILAKHNSIVLTHTPKKDWCSNSLPEKNFVYVSGHTHKSYFYDDGEFRIYADNQIGYKNTNPHLKTFALDDDFDLFSDFNDGIYEITPEQYKDFYLGKHIPTEFNQKCYLYMLKKNGYYCFICKAKNGNLSIMHGGAPKALAEKDVQYYFDNMDAMISTLKTPLDKFTAYQKQISDLVKKIGGSGIIHGSIIDIDFCNHIYVNPMDLSITGYCASDMVNKVVYPSVPALLEENCPKLHREYLKQIERGSKNALAPSTRRSEKLSPQMYFDTNIYFASREIKKMQRLDANILSVWHEEILLNREFTPRQLQSKNAK